NITDLTGLSTGRVLVTSLGLRSLTMFDCEPPRAAASRLASSPACCAWKLSGCGTRGTAGAGAGMLGVLKRQMAASYWFLAGLDRSLPTPAWFDNLVVNPPDRQIVDQAPTPLAGPHGP